MPEGVCSWQFNFKFNLFDDMYAEESVDLLLNSGLKFDRHERECIEPIHFAEMLMVSGIVLLNNVKWLELRLRLPTRHAPQQQLTRDGRGVLQDAQDLFPQRLRHQVSYEEL